MVHKNSKKTASSIFRFNTFRFGSGWILFCIIIPFLVLLFYGLRRDCYNFNQYLLSLIIGFSGLSVIIINYIKPRNPFQGNWLLPRSVQMSTEEEKVLQFLIVSKQAKRLYINLGIFLFFLPFIAIFFINFLFPIQGNKTVKIDPIAMGSVGYVICSVLLYCFIIERYITSRWDEIQKMKLDLNDKYKRYSESWHKEIGSQRNKSSLISDVLSIDPNTPFDLRLFMILMLIVGSIGLIIWGMGALGFLFNKISMHNFILRIIGLISGIILINISARMWYKTQKKL